MKREQRIQKRSLRVSSETIRTLSTSQLIEVAGGQIVPTQQALPTICLACQR